MSAGQRAPFENVKKLNTFLHLDHPDEVFAGAELCTRLGIPRGSLHGSFGYLQRTDPRFIQPSRGFYCYRRTSVKPRPVVQDELPKTNGRAFGLIGPASSGELVLQSESGDLYLARKL